MEGRSIVEDRRPRNSYHRVCYVFVAQAASACHWNWTAMGDGYDDDDKVHLHLPITVPTRFRAISHHGRQSSEVPSRCRVRQRLGYHSVPVLSVD